MDLDATLATFAQNFVQREQRERFIHEAKNKPAKLMTRVCHQIAGLFEERFLNGVCTVQEANECIIFSGAGRVAVITWKEAMRIVEIGGGGVLIIDKSGKHFLALAEGYPPPIQYAGNA